MNAILSKAQQIAAINMAAEKAGGSYRNYVARLTESAKIQIYQEFKAYLVDKEMRMKASLASIKEKNKAGETDDSGEWMGQEWF